MSIAGSWGKHSACCSYLYLFTQLFSPSFKQKTLAQKSEMEIKLGGLFWRLLCSILHPWALSRDVGSRDFQSLPLCWVKGTSTKWIVLGASGCGRGYYKVLTSCCEAWMCSLLQGCYLKPLGRKGIEQNALTVLRLPPALPWEDFEQ